MRKVIGVVVALVACGGSSSTVSTKAPAPASPPPSPGITVLPAAPPDALVLEVRAVRWSCRITHPRDVVTDALVVPAGRPIKLVVATPELPERAPGLEVSFVGASGRFPVVKDKPVEIAFRVDVPGTYRWKCPTLTPDKPDREPDVVSGEYRAQFDPEKPFTVVSAADYDAMIAANTQEDPANRVAFGRTLYEKKGCVACHTIDGTPRVGPSWAGIWGTKVTLADGSTRVVDESYVRASLFTPTAFARPGFPPVMPSFEGQLRDRELAALVAFIESLKR